MNPEELDALSKRVSSRVALVNASVCAVIAGLIAFFDSSIVPGFAAGFATGALNIHWLLKIARRSVKMSPEKAGRFVTLAYPIRFALVAALFALFIVKGADQPLAAGRRVRALDRDSGLHNDLLRKGGKLQCMTR